VEVNMPIRVLVTGAGGPAAIAFIQSFFRSEVTFFAADMDTNAAGLYLVPKSHRAIVPEANSPLFVQALIDLCKLHSIDVVVPTVDTELIKVSRAREEFEAVGARVAIGSPLSLTWCLNKALLMAACSSTGAVPKWAVLDDAFDPDEFDFPLVVKPVSGSGGRGVRIVETPEALEAIPRSNQLLVQEYLPGEELSVDVFAREDGHVIAAVPRVRMKVDSGVAVTAKTVHDAEVEKMAIAIAKVVGITGIANIQLRRNREGAPRLLEINPRLPGSMPLTVAAGVDMPRMLLESALGRVYSDARLPFREVAMVRTWQEHFLSPSELGRTACDAEWDEEYGTQRPLSNCA
jgi:carbamoyl-phosphate synthase large subunit